jgi:hypothetical protein
MPENASYPLRVDARKPGDGINRWGAATQVSSLPLMFSTPRGHADNDDKDESSSLSITFTWSLEKSAA